MSPENQEIEPHTCFIPTCANSNTRTPNVTLFAVRNDLKKSWCELVNRDCPEHQIYCCENHLNLDEDFEDHMGSPRLKLEATLKNIPKALDDSAPPGPKTYSRKVNKTRQSISASCTLDIQTLNYLLENSEDYIECQPEGIKRQSPNSHASLVKKQKTATSEEWDFAEADRIPTIVLPEENVTISGGFNDQDSQTAKKEIGQREKAKSKDVSVQTTVVPEKHISNSKAEKKKNDVNITNMSPSCTQLVINATQYPDSEKRNANRILQTTIKKIMRKSTFYTGLPVSCCHLLIVIGDKTKIPEHHLLLCLKKIRLNSEFMELADDFAVTLSEASELFLKNIPSIACVLRPFILKKGLQSTKRTTPLAFRRKYSNVACIIDCLEIKVQQTSNLERNKQTDKKVDTVKYLISCTPNGVINYVSQGYNGNIIDTNLVESCDFFDYLGKGMCVMVDGGFKDIERRSHSSGVQFVRTPSDRINLEKKEGYTVASLRKPIDSVMRCLRKFAMLKCSDMDTVKVIDEIVIVACAFVNLRESFS